MRVVDVFAGIGGLSLGWQLAGHEIVAAVERNAYCAESYRRNFPEAVVYGANGSDGDVTHHPVNFLKALQPDVVVGGPPCQAFSVMGKNDLADSRRSMVGRFVSIAVAARPRIVVMENVPGILRSRHASVINEARTSLEAAGYRTAQWVLDAADMGVPQTRRRVILVATRDRPPDPPANRARTTVSAAIADLPGVSGDSPWPVDPSEYALSLGADTVPLTGHRFSKHHDSTIRRLSALGFGQVDEPTGMRRLDPQRTSWTLRASARNGTACRPVHPFDPRVITPREAARLSGFPDSVDLSDNIAQAIADVGNAVPPPMSLAVALAVTQYPSAPQASGGLHRRNSLDRDVFQSPIP